MREVNWRNLRPGRDYYIFDEELARNPRYSGKKRGTFLQLVYLNSLMDSWSSSPNGVPFARFTNLTYVNDKDSGLGIYDTNEFNTSRLKFYEASPKDLIERVARNDAAVKTARKTLVKRAFSRVDPYLSYKNTYLGGKTKKSRKNRVRA